MIENDPHVPYAAQVIILTIPALGSLITAILCIYSVYMMDIRQKLAFQGDDDAAKKLILPCYRPLYIGLIITYIIITISILVTLKDNNISNPILYFVLQGYSLCILTTFLILPLLFVQYAVSLRSFIITTKILLPWFLISITCLILNYVHITNYGIPNYIFLFFTFFPSFIFTIGILSKVSFYYVL